ncbi:hypothetical protein ACFLU6_09455 [Acidobacteriota bacterium]
MGILMILGWLLLVVGAIWIIVLAFKHSILWGILCLIFGPCQIIFAIMNWGVCKKPFLIMVVGLILMIVGMIFGGSEMIPTTP